MQDVVEQRTTKDIAYDEAKRVLLEKGAKEGTDRFEREKRKEGFAVLDGIAKTIGAAMLQVLWEMFKAEDHIYLGEEQDFVKYVRETYRQDPRVDYKYANQMALVITRILDRLDETSPYTAEQLIASEAVSTILKESSFDTESMDQEQFTALVQMIGDGKTMQEVENYRKTVLGKKVVIRYLAEDTYSPVTGEKFIKVVMFLTPPEYSYFRSRPNQKAVLDENALFVRSEAEGDEQETA